MSPNPVPRRALLAGLLVLVSSCGERVASQGPDLGAGEPCLGPAFEGAPLGVRCGALVDAAGRQVLVHGVNARVLGVFDDRLDDGTHTFGPIPAFDASDARALRAMGFSALRLPFHWSALEPTEDGGFDDAYLERMAAIVDVCRAASVWVLIDLHQDGYTKYVGDDGAPKWATLPAPPPRNPNDPGRLVGGPALRAFDTFFGDNPDGARLRARFARMYEKVARRFASDDNVIGFEVYNEPIAPEARLVPFYKEVLAAVRAEAPKKLVWFEPNAVRNVVDYAPLGEGSIGPGTVYAPHVYTGVFAKVQGPLTRAALQHSNESARDEARSYAAPCAITEWGYGQKDALFPDVAQWQKDWQDEYLLSDFFWVWKEAPPNEWGFYDIDAVTTVATARSAAMTAFARPRVEAAAGRLSSVRYDRAARRLEVRFAGDVAIRAPNRIGLGRTAGFAAATATCDGQPAAITRGEPLEIPCGGAGEHVLVLSGM